MRAGKVFAGLAVTAASIVGVIQRRTWWRAVRPRNGPVDEPQPPAANPALPDEDPPPPTPDDWPDSMPPIRYTGDWREWRGWW